ncbi:phenylacetate--CoA ligase family protein [Algibacter sp. L4_22]|uniref:phenylacetate--CoA ligase family protein n=1 Tax=Algibacter sp. L4_22 TaxID=2942477 RepID=UPI00201B6FC7|nr:phenylacetate--CoA ligase family protein [Algibacter sp. L4_22]MCL5127268.1 phenylacetate--CoA ligase family protein [Algibacter sp. L4_22]
MKLFNLSLKLKGFPIKEAKAFLKTIQSKQKLDFQSYIETSKRDILDHHLKHNPFYKQFVKNVDLSDWNSIPVMTKRDLQQPLEQRLSEGFTAKTVFINKTSGSSGTPFIFAKDKFCHALIWANFMDRYSCFNLDLNHSKQARFYGIPLDKKDYYKERFKDALSNRFRFSVFDLSDSQLEKNIEKFSKTKFDYINGYTSSIVQFAKYLEQHNIVLKTICPSLKACITTSEMLFREDKNLLEAQLGIPVINEYGAAELGLIAFQNKTDQWVVNTEDLFVEILDKNNNVLPYGEEGRIVITSLYNKAHPFIRYDLGDIGTLSKKSTLQKPILEKLVGRTSDLVMLPSGKKAAGLTFYYVTKTIIENDGNVKEFIIEQLKLDTFKISYVSNKLLTKENLEHIKKAISKYLEPHLIVVFERKEKLERSKSGKLKQFKSYLS